MSERLQPCRCGGTGSIAEAHYPTWGQVECDSCDRIEFGCDEETAVAKWNCVVKESSPTEAARQR